MAPGGLAPVKGLPGLGLGGRIITHTLKPVKHRYLGRYLIVKPTGKRLFFSRKRQISAPLVRL